MTVLLFFLGVFVLFRVGAYLNRVDKEQQEKFKGQTEKKAKQCPPHRWSYNYEDRLQCTECNMKAGDISTENGKY